MGSRQMSVFLMSPDAAMRQDLESLPGVRLEGFSAEAPLALAPPGGPAVMAWILDEQACQGRSPAVFQNLWDGAQLALIYRGQRPNGTVDTGPSFRWPEEREGLRRWLSECPDARPELGAGWDRCLATASVVGVVGPRGGVGKTLVAANLAASAAMSGAACVLVDLDLQLPSAHIYLGLQPDGGIVSLLPYLDGPPEEAWSKNVATHGPTGLSLLAGPQRPELAELVEPGQLKRILDLCRSRYQAVVLDLPPGLASGRLWDCLSCVDHILMVTRPDPHAVDSVRAWLDLAGRLAADLPDMTLVVNGVHSGAPMRGTECARYLGLGRAVELPLDLDGVSGGLAAGRPVVMDWPRSDLGGRLSGLAARIWSLQSRGGPRGGVWTRALGRFRQLVR